MIVRRKPSVEGLLERLSRRTLAAPSQPLSGGIEGPEGPEGPKGDTGATGPEGPEGPEGSGDISGPESSTDNAIARWDGTEADKLQDSGVTINDSDLLSASGGVSAPAGGANTEVFGAGASGAHADSVLVGKETKTGGADSTIIGYQADASGGGTWNTLIGSETSASGAGGTAIGGLASAGFNGFALGFNASAGGFNSLALANQASAGFDYSIALGALSATTATHQLVIGGQFIFNAEINDVYIGNGVQQNSPASPTINATGGKGTDKVGGAIALAGGKGTGTGSGGGLELQIALPGGASGAALNSLSTVLSISGEDGALQHENFPLGFYGVAPTSRQVLPTGSTTDEVIEALQALGLVSQE